MKQKIRQWFVSVRERLVVWNERNKTEDARRVTKHGRRAKGDIEDKKIMGTSKL